MSELVVDWAYFGMFGQDLSTYQASMLQILCDQNCARVLFVHEKQPDFCLTHHVDRAVRSCHFIREVVIQDFATDSLEYFFADNDHVGTGVENVVH